MGLFAIMLPQETGSEKSKMTASNLEILISQLVHKIAMKFQRQHQCFRGPATNDAIAGTVSGRRKSKMAATKPAILISQLLYAATVPLSFWTSKTLG